MQLKSSNSVQGNIQFWTIILLSENRQFLQITPEVTFVSMVAGPFSILKNTESTGH